MPVWAWALVAVAAFIVVGAAAAALLGVAGMPGDALRRAWYTVTMRGHVYRGTGLPPEVPEAEEPPPGGDRPPPREG